ncbi:glutathione synthase [Porticoccus sp.]
MNRTLGVVMDPIEAINPKKDTTLALLLAARQKGWQLMYMKQSQLAIENGEPTAIMTPLEVQDDLQHWFTLGAARQAPLSSLDVILMRKDPPFDSEYIYTTYILEAAEKRGVLVANKPQSLRDCNEKVFATLFPQCSPPLLVSRDTDLLKRFRQLHEDVVYKPLDGMGGTAVFRVRPGDPNLNVILEMLTEHGKRTIMAQKFIPDISNGDKRILMVDGEPIPYCLARIPAEGELRGNLAAGGTGVVRPLTERDQWIAAQIGPALKERGILFAGLDVIGDYLTEINITSPTCAREIDREKNTNIGGKLMDALAKRLG